MIKWFILYSIAFCFFYVLYWAFRFHNKYKCVFIFGKKGCGKSTLIQKLAIRYINKGYTVYSNTPVAGGVYLYDPKKIGLLQFEPNSVVFCDEVSTIFHNRDFKKMEKATRDWFAMMRHRKIIFYCFSQTFNNTDKVIRDQCDKMYIMTNILGVLSVAKYIMKGPKVYGDNTAGEDHVGDGLVISPFFTAPFGGRMYTWIPKYAKYFDSFECEPLPLEEFTYYDAGKDVYHVTILTRIFTYLKYHFSRVRDFLANQKIFKKPGEDADGQSDQPGVEPCSESELADLGRFEAVASAGGDRKSGGILSGRYKRYASDDDGSDVHE